MLKKGRFLLLFLWAIPIGLFLSLTVGPHFAAHKKDVLTGLLNPNSHSFHVYHFLSLECLCSKKIIRHLLQRRSVSNIDESIYLIRSEQSEIVKLRNAGYQVFPLTEDEAVKQFNIQVVPQLVIVKGKKIVYQGGYGPDQQHSEIYYDDIIINSVSTNQSIKEMPIFGCANGELRKSSFDILKIKYDSLKGN